MQDEVLQPIPDDPHEDEESYQLLVSKHLIPPPLMLLPKLIDNKPNSLLPMIPLPAFVGLIPQYQPLSQVSPNHNTNDDIYFNWIGEAFVNVIYRKYDETSYLKIEGIDENWNIWSCDVTKLKDNNTSTNLAEVVPYYQLKHKADTTLLFESRFESGNLSMVSKASQQEYNLLLQNDINTNGYTQWFFFKVNNTQATHKVKFNILNLYKHNSLYKLGMKIVIYSVKESESKNISWHRGGENICYYENGYSKSTQDYKPFFTLSWEYTFPHSDDEVYFAYNYPFTYTNLETQIERVESDPFLRNICQRSLICKTAAGNRVDVLTITEDHPFMELDKTYIVITARIHPGQSVSSYVCNGILDFLLSNNQKAKKLRYNFIFKIVPMLNPDGVIHGNYRSNITGYDLNRKWQNPSKLYHPQIYYLKKMILGLQQIGQVLLFCDLHGHSMKKNAFIYGCHDNNNPKGGKLFPLLVSQLFKGFSFKDCSFLVKEEKQGTSRSVLSKEMPHQNIYTLESSFCGPEYQDIHFTVRHFEELGQKFCESILLCFKDKIRDMQIDAAMKQKSYFPNQESSMDSVLLPETLDDDINQSMFEERVNSENSQGSEEQDEKQVLLEEKTIKKHLLLRSQRPSTSITTRAILRKSLSKDLTKDLGGLIFKKSELSIQMHKSISPVKRKQLYQQPKVEKIKIETQTEKLQKHNIEPKLFVPIDFIGMPTSRRHHQSTSRLDNKKQQPNLRTNFRVTLSKNVSQQKSPPEQEKTISVFRNSSLKGLLTNQPKRQKRNSDFLIRKASKIQYYDDKSSTNLFKSVLSSLKREKN